MPSNQCYYINEITGGDVSTYEAKFETRKLPTLATMIAAALQTATLNLDIMQSEAKTLECDFKMKMQEF